jgi:hypothetical protein
MVGRQWGGVISLMPKEEQEKVMTGVEQRREPKFSIVHPSVGPKKSSSAQGKTDHETSRETDQSPTKIKAENVNNRGTRARRSPSKVPSVSLTTDQSDVLATISLTFLAANTSPVFLGLPHFKLNDCMFKLSILFPTVGELGSTGYAILAGDTMRFRTLTVETSISGRGNGVLRRD